jgi:hypothetical protein
MKPGLGFWSMEPCTYARLPHSFHTCTDKANPYRFSFCTIKVNSTCISKNNIFLHTSNHKHSKKCFLELAKSLFKKSHNKQNTASKSQEPKTRIFLINQGIHNPCHPNLALFQSIKMCRLRPVSLAQTTMHHYPHHTKIPRQDTGSLTSRFRVGLSYTSYI